MSDDPSIIGIFCEDIRAEVNGLHTIVGVLPENIDFPKLPAIFPKLYLYIRYRLDPSIDPGPISVEWVMPNGTSIAKTALDAAMVKEARETAIANKAPLVGFISQFMASPLQLAEPGRILAVAHVGDRSFVCASLYVNVRARQSAT
jgi:Family of unknown function (DUF6941)